MKPKKVAGRVRKLTEISSSLLLYTRQLFVSFWGLLGIVPAILGLLAFYRVLLPQWLIDIFKPSWVLYLYLFLVFLIAGYRVWKKKEIVNKVTYDLDFRKEKITFADDYKKIKKEKEFAQRKAEQASPERTGHLFAFTEFLGKSELTKEDWLGYLQELDEYEQKIKEIERLTKSWHLVNLHIHNTGNYSDDEVNIELQIEGAKKVHEDLELYMPTFPRRPEVGTWQQRMFSNVDLNIDPRYEGGVRRTNIKVTDSYVEVEFNRLHADEDVLLLNDGLFIAGDSVKLDFTLRSRQIREPIHLTKELRK